MAIALIFFNEMPGPACCHRQTLDIIFEKRSIPLKMKYSIYIILFIGVLSCSQPTNESNIPADFTTYELSQFYENEKILGGDFSTDDKNLLITSKKTGIYNVFGIAVDGSGITQLTTSEVESYFAVGYFPNDSRILYSSDQGGNENNHLFVFGEGRTKDITPQEGSKNHFFGWSRDDKSLYIRSNGRDSRFFDLNKLTISQLNDEVIIGETLYQNNNGFSMGAISANERFVALVENITTSVSNMHIYDRDSQKFAKISQGEDDSSEFPQYFSNDSMELYYLTNEGSEFTYLMKYNPESEERVKVYETNWDVMYAFHSYNEKYRVVGVNEEARTAIHIFELSTGKEVALPEIDGGDIISASISRSEKLIRLTVGSAKSSNNLYVYNFETGELRQLTNTLNPEINSDHLVEAQAVRFKSFDGTEIPAIYYQPHLASSKNRVPGLIWVHGGPGGQSRRTYFELIQYLVNEGYAILAVNNRGSSGYGKSFNRMDDLKHGEGDLQDCVEGKKFFESTGVVDMEKVGIIGGSYGGYMVMAALAFQPEEFDVGVNIFGVTNWLRTLKSVPPHWESFRKALYEELGDPGTEDSVRLIKISPLFHASNVTKPLMVLQGANDVRVLQVESDEIVEAVRANGVPVEYVIFDDEGHGFRKKENELEGYGKIREFLDKYLKGIAKDVEQTD